MGLDSTRMIRAPSGAPLGEISRARAANAHAAVALRARTTTKPPACNTISHILAGAGRPSELGI
jgi:hypothetical protein